MNVTIPILITIHSNLFAERRSRIGRSFFFSGRNRKAGLNADLGITIHRSINPPESYINEIFPFSGSLGIFLQILKTGNL